MMTVAFPGGYPSFVWFESTLEWRGCTPEAVRPVRCVPRGVGASFRATFKNGRSLAVIR